MKESRPLEQTEQRRYDVVAAKYTDDNYAPQPEHFCKHCKFDKKLLPYRFGHEPRKPKEAGKPPAKYEPKILKRYRKK